ncbi:hypothetical protein [Candidatus Cryosericum septentrionale]|uniref:hypothetical protein n=1 Tax=Candidatus Cryosericum septentrionale TaxID=2290913 RepID=UPI000F86A557|nr:hypothetical protein [Candidatus Cryosericum septentrionale]
MIFSNARDILVSKGCFLQDADEYVQDAAGCVWSGMTDGQSRCASCLVVDPVNLDWNLLLAD